MNSLCLACLHHKLRRIRRYRTNTRYGRVVFTNAWLYECCQCGLVQAVPRPASQVLADYYALDYRRGGFYGSDVANTSQFPKDNLFYYNRGQSIAELVSPHVRIEKPRILDVGAGYGHILYALGQRYPHSTRLAIEFSEVCVQHLTSLGVQVLTQPMEESLSHMEQQFDLIVLSHVFEHLLDPHGALQLFYKSLAPGGVLYIEVPNIPADALLRYPDHVWAPRYDEPHITFFSVSTLCRMLESAGFALQFCNTAGAEYTYISWLQFHLPHWRWFLQRLLPSPVFHWLRRQRFTQPIRVPERVASFYQYGGCRIWIRSVSTKNL
jgi:SAM-dependent methyltransferase